MRKMYSKNQIKEIIKKALESGEITGGTKLYKHTMNVIDTAVNEHNVVMISTLKEEIENGEPLLDYLEGCISLTSESCNIIFGNNDSFYMLVDGALENMNLITIVSDEVTPL